MKGLEEHLGELVTEKNNPDTVNIDSCSTRELVRMINREDRKVALAVDDQEEQIAEAIDLAAEKLKKGGRMFYVGAGTSGRLGVVDASECKATYGVPPEMVQAVIPGGAGTVRDASQGDEDDFEEGYRQISVHGITDKDVVVGIAASGRTPYVLGAMTAAREQRALTVGICNNPQTMLHSLAEVIIAVVTGPEVIQGSTRMKAGTAQKLVLNMLSTGVMVKLGKTYNNLMVDLYVNNQKLEDRACRIVMQATGADGKDAYQALRQCDFQVKTAIVCLLKSCGKEQAGEYLAQSEGRIAKIAE